MFKKKVNGYMNVFYCLFLVFDNFFYNEVCSIIIRVLEMLNCLLCGILYELIIECLYFF